MRKSEKEYLLTRAAQERSQAENASDELIREIHLKLAHEYTSRAEVEYIDERPGDHVYGATSVGDRSS